jgi:serine/threonine protein kinase
MKSARFPRKIESRRIDLSPFKGEIAALYALPEILAAAAGCRALLNGPGSEILLDSSKAFKAWRGASALIEKSHETRFLIAYLEKRKHGFVERCFYLAERISGGREIKALFRELPDSELKPLLSSLASVLRECHDDGLLHRDLSDGNILVRSEENGKADGGQEFHFYFLDTNRIRLRKKPGSLARAKNLIRLGIPSHLRLFFLGQYAAPRPIRKMFVFWYRLTKRLYEGKIRFKKALKLKKLAGKFKIR